MFPSLDQAIAQFEGYGKPGTLATVNNNPGNLIAGSFANSHGATGGNNGFAVFPDSATGLAAQDSLVQYYANNGYSVGDMIGKWNGQGANSSNYTDFVTQQTGATASTPISSLANVGSTGSGTNSNWLGILTGELSNSDLPGSNLAGQLGATNPVGQAVNGVPIGSFFGISWTRIAAFVIGLICLIVGLMSFKPVNDVVVNVTEKVKGAAEVAAVAA